MLLRFWPRGFLWSALDPPAAAAGQGFASAGLFALGWEGSGVVQPPGLGAVLGDGTGAARVGTDPPNSIPGDIPGDTGCRCQQWGWGMPQGAGEGVHLAGGEAERRVPSGCPSPELALRALLTHPGAELCAAKAGPERMNRFRPGPIWFLLRGSAASSLPAAQLSPRPAHPSPQRRESEDSRSLASSPALPAAAPHRTGAAAKGAAGCFPFPPGPCL